MKKIIIILTALFLALSSSGCTGPKGDTGPAGAGGTIFSRDFQYGRLPDAGYYTAYDSVLTNSTYANYNFGACMSLFCGTTSYINRSVLKFDLSTMNPPDVKVKKAVLTLQVFGSAGAVTVTAYALNTAWAIEGTADCLGLVNGYVSWNFFTNPGGDYNASAAVSNSVAKNSAAPDVNDPVHFDLNPAMVQDWITHPYLNNGVIIVSSSESTFGYVVFYSKENSIRPDYAPRLTVFYEMP